MVVVRTLDWVEQELERTKEARPDYFVKAVVKVYDTRDDEAPQVWEGSTLQDFVGVPEYLWDVKEDYEIDEEDKVIYLYLEGYKVPPVEVRELRKKLEEEAENMNAGEYKIVGRVDFLPSDWEKYRQFGCDTDGGNYCQSAHLIVWKNPQTREAEHYIVWTSTRSIGGDKKIILDREGRLIDVEEEHVKEDDTVILDHLDFKETIEKLEGPYSIKEVLAEWYRIVQQSEREREDYEKWLEERY